MTGGRDEVQIQLAEMKARDDELFTLTTAVLLLWSREDEERENDNDKLRKQNDRERQLLRERLQSMVEERESANKERHEVLSSMDAQSQKKREKQNKKMRMLVEKEIRRKEKKEKEEDRKSTTPRGGSHNSATLPGGKKVSTHPRIFHWRKKSRGSDIGTSLEPRENKEREKEKDTDKSPEKDKPLQRTPSNPVRAQKAKNPDKQSSKSLSDGEDPAHLSDI